MLHRSLKTNVFLLTSEEAPSCQSCSSPLTLKHILLNYSAFNVTRQSYYSIRVLGESLFFFEKVTPENVLEFVYEINLKQSIQMLTLLKVKFLLFTCINFFVCLFIFCTCSHRRYCAKILDKVRFLTKHLS